MAERRRMTAFDVVAGVLAGEHGDFVREAVAVVARGLMKAEVSAEVGAQLGKVAPDAAVDVSQWVSRAAVGDAGWGDQVAGPEKARGAGVLPHLPRAQAAL